MRLKACKGIAASVKGPLTRAKCLNLRLEHSRIVHHGEYLVSTPVANGVLNTIPNVAKDNVAKTEGFTQLGKFLELPVCTYSSGMSTN
ncbi:MAG: hypothetical protein ACOYB1_08825 [Limnohabitans sp.]